MNGIVIVDKPSGWTSQDVTARLRRVFGTRRIGHGGTLDPMATGVLPVFVGRATRGVEFFEHAEKGYEALLIPGLTTDTEDVTGNVLSRQQVLLTQQQLEAVLPRFRGEIMQIPPMYSALKVNGQKLCDLARRGKEIPRQPRPVTIHELKLLGFEEGNPVLRVRCSKGTYIRTLCKDIGQALGCGGCMGYLRRVQAGNTRCPTPYPCKPCWKRPIRRNISVRWTPCSAVSPPLPLPPTRKNAAATATPSPCPMLRAATVPTARAENFSCWPRSAEEP